MSRRITIIHLDQSYCCDHALCTSLADFHVAQLTRSFEHAEGAGETRGWLRGGGVHGREPEHVRPLAPRSGN